jgi:hypothetical protein
MVLENCLYVGYIGTSSGVSYNSQILASLLPLTIAIYIRQPPFIMGI